MELRLTNTSLAGWAVQLECGVLVGRDEFFSSQSPACHDLQRAFAALGAKVTTDFESFVGDGAVADGVDVPSPNGIIIARYIDVAKNRDFCGWTLVPSLLTLTYFPCIEDSTASARLVLKDASGPLRTQYDLTVNARSIYGLWAFGPMLSRKFNAKDRRRQAALAENLIQYIQNELVTFVYRVNQLGEPARSLVEGPSP